MAGGEDELESFRRQWREEVARRDAAVARQSQKANNFKASSQHATNGPGKKKQAAPPTAAPSAHTAHDDSDFQPRTFHDIEDKEEHLKLGNEATREKARAAEPESALEFYEKAVEEEDAGKLGKSVALYRKAFKVSLLLPGPDHIRY